MSARITDADLERMLERLARDWTRITPLPAGESLILDSYTPDARTLYALHLGSPHSGHSDRLQKRRMLKGEMYHAMDLACHILEEVAGGLIYRREDP